jgi:hypothetical protein
MNGRETMALFVSPSALLQICAADLMTARKMNRNTNAHKQCKEAKSADEPLESHSSVFSV